MKTLRMVVASALVLSAITTLAGAANILQMAVFATYSHKSALDPIAEELARRGHQVTFATPVKVTKATKGIKEVYLSLAGAEWQNYSETFFDSKPGDPETMNKLFAFMYRLCNATYRDVEVRIILENPARFQYDVLVIDGVFNDFLLPIAHHLKIPVVVASPGSLLAPLAMALNIPTPFSYIDSGILLVQGPMTFTERIQSSFINLMMMHQRYANAFPTFDRIIHETLPNAPRTVDLERNISFVMTNTHPAMHHSRPTMPYYKEVGCLHCTPAKPLPKELEDFMQSSGDDGVIFFSLGSVTKGENMPMDMRDKIVEGFRQLPQKVLWKYEKPIPNLPKNIKLTKWAPQQDILGHSKTRLFITHGGGLSTQEAVYHACPVLGFPLGAEQMGNIGSAVHKGYAEVLLWRTFTMDEFVTKIKKILHDKRYQEKANYLSAVLKDQPEKPAERAAYWIEYVIRHKGAHHLKSGAERLNYFQYFLLDIIGLVLLVAVVTILVVYWVLKKLYRFIFVKRSQNEKKKRN